MKSRWTLRFYSIRHSEVKRTNYQERLALRLTCAPVYTPRVLRRSKQAALHYGWLDQYAAGSFDRREDGHAVAYPLRRMPTEDQDWGFADWFAGFIGRDIACVLLEGQRTGYATRVVSVCVCLFVCLCVCVLRASRSTCSLYGWCIYLAAEFSSCVQAAYTQMNMY